MFKHNLNFANINLVEQLDYLLTSSFFFFWPKIVDHPNLHKTGRTGLLLFFHSDNWEVHWLHWVSYSKVSLLQTKHMDNPGRGAPINIYVLSFSSWVLQIQTLTQMSFWYQYVKLWPLIMDIQLFIQKGYPFGQPQLLNLFTPQHIGLPSLKSV